MAGKERFIYNLPVRIQMPKTDTGKREKGILAAVLVVLIAAGIAISGYKLTVESSLYLALLLAQPVLFLYHLGSVSRSLYRLLLVVLALSTLIYPMVIVYGVSSYFELVGDMDSNRVIPSNALLLAGIIVLSSMGNLVVALAMYSISKLTPRIDFTKNPDSYDLIKKTIMVSVAILLITVVVIGFFIFVS